jgi:hypothetical protein
MKSKRYPLGPFTDEELEQRYVESAKLLIKYLRNDPLWRDLLNCVHNGNSRYIVEEFYGGKRWDGFTNFLILINNMRPWVIEVLSAKVKV